MKNRLLFFLLAILTPVLVLSCSESSDSPKGDPSFISFEIQTYGDLTGGVFEDGGTTLTRYIREYAADDEDNCLGGYSSAVERLDIIGFANEDLHDGIESIRIYLPSAIATGPGSYVFDSQNSEHDYFSIRIESDYGLWLTGASEHYTDPGTSMSVTLTEVSDDWIKGSFSAELEAWICTENLNGSISLARDDEISDVNIPVVNGTFEVFRMEF